MKKRILLFILISIALIFFISGCTKVGLKAEIDGKIEAANYCDTASDCKIASFGCPFGCWNLVNKDANIEEINRLVEERNKGEVVCVYSCLSPPEEKDIKCVNKKCVAEERVAECFTDFDCGIGGCSGQVCTTKDKAKSIITTCEYLPIYDCYKQTTCSCINSKCEWRETEKFLECREKVGEGEVIV